MCIGYLPPLILQMFFAAGGIFPTVIARLLIKYRRNPEGPKAKRNTPCPLHLVLIYLVTLFDPKFQIFKSSQSWRFLAFFMKSWPLNIVNVARFARNVEWDFFMWFSNTVKWCPFKNWTLRYHCISCFIYFI